MKVLITGSEGFIGTHIVQALRNPDILIYTFDSLDFFNDWTEFCDPNVIIHCGAIADSGYDKPDIFLQNTEATIKLIEFACNTNSKFIFLSTQMASKPNNLYGWSKRYAEEFISNIGNPYNLCILRLPNVVGDEHFEKEGRNPSILTKVKKGTLDFVVPGYKRRLIHVDELVKIILKLLDDWTPGIFNTTSSELSIEDMILESHDYTVLESIPNKTSEETGIPLTIELDYTLPYIKFIE